MRRIAFQIIDRVQAHFLADLILQLPAHEFRNQHFIFERTDLQDQLDLLDTQKFSSDFCDQGVSRVACDACLGGCESENRYRPLTISRTSPNPQITMTQRYRQRISHVGRLGQLVQTQFTLDRLLHL